MRRSLPGLERRSFPLEPSVALLESAWPVDAIWRANQPDAPESAVDLDAGGVRLEVRRVGDDVVYRALGPATFALRAALGAGQTLERAIEQALDADAAFDLAGEIRALLDERLLRA